jgi:hypothetical protein
MILEQRTDETRLLDDYATSYWLKAQLLASRARDPVDALRDAEILVAVLRQRLRATCSAALRSAPPPA